MKLKARLTWWLEDRRRDLGYALHALALQAWPRTYECGCGSMNCDLDTGRPDICMTHETQAIIDRALENLHEGKYGSIGGGHEPG